MDWKELLNTPVTDLFKRKSGESAPPEAAALAKSGGSQKEEAAPKGMLGAFYRKWKDPAFLKQARILAAHMANEGVDLKSQDQVKAWIDKNKEAIEAGKFAEAPPEGGAKVVTYEKKGPDVGRNEPCTCGSGKKFKKCCGNK